MFGLRQELQRPKRVDRRAAAREVIELPAWIAYGYKNIPCVTVNISGAGARLRLLSPAILPAEIVVSVPERDVERRARTIWRDGEHVGLEYI